MKKCCTLLICLLFLFISCEEKDPETFDIIISNASIVDVNTGKVSLDQIILINNDTISRIEEAKNINNFKGRQMVDAEGNYVLPGLWDMHVHFRGGDTLIKENKELLPLFLAYGITSVRDAGGDITPAVLEWRDAIEKGELAGPNIFTPGPKLDGTEPAWPGSISVTNTEDTQLALDSLVAMGVDYVKMYDGNLTREAYYEIIAAAEKRGLKSTGHMPLTANFLEAIDLGLDGAEHMYYPLMACSPIADSLTGLGMGYGVMEKIIDTYDPELAAEVFEKMSSNKVYVTPTLHIGTTLAEILDTDHSQDSLLTYVGNGIQETYKGRIEGAKRAKNSGSQMREKMEQISERMIRPMFDAGVNILSGSDCGAFNSFVYPGQSFHGELQSLVKAGLTPQEALQTSLVNGPEFFDLQEYYGEVAAGKVADLIFLKNNPLEDIENLTNIQVVIKGGKIYNRTDLNKLLEGVKN